MNLIIDKINKGYFLELEKDGEIMDKAMYIGIPLKNVIKEFRTYNNLKGKKLITKKLFNEDK